MSEAVNATEAWVKEAKRILAIEATGGSAKDMPTAGEYLKLVDDAFKVVGDGKPAEMSKTDWDSICFTIAAMKQRMLQKNVSSAVSEARKPQNQNKPPLMALWNVAVHFAGAYTPLIEDVERRRAAMLELRKTKRPEDVLSAAGLEELTICDDPGPVFAKAEALTARNAEAKKKLPRTGLQRLLDVPAATQTTLEITGFIAELDLDTADERLSALETEITDRLRELDEVTKLIKRRTLTPQDATMVQLRKLNVLEKQFAEVEKDFPDAVQAAEEAAFKAEGKSKVQPKMQQTASLKLAMTKAIKDWPTLPLATQLSNNGMGSVTYLLDRMLVLGKSPGKTVEQLAKEKQDAINTLFAAFKLDMAKRWGEYVQSNYHKNFRGPNPSPGIMTNEVKARCAEVQTVKVGSRTYVYSESVSEGNSMKTPLPPPWETNSNGDLIRSFIYHLKVG